MKLITAHLEYLLTEHDCVIVPGFGGFVMQHVEAFFSEEGVYPPSTEICFNSELIHDDGMLLASISNVEGVSYIEARRLVVNELELFRTKLSSESLFELGSIGSFCFDDRHNLVFHSSQKKYPHPLYFGFSHTNLTLLKDFEKRIDQPLETSERKDADVIQIRVSKRKAFRVAASAAAIWLLWVFSSPVGDNRSMTSCAGFINRDELSKVMQQYRSNTVVDHVAKKDTVETTVIKEKSEPNVTVAVKEEVTIAELSNEDEMPKYYVILGSFHGEDKAQLHRDQLIHEGIKNVKVKKLGTMVRTYLSSFSDKSTAEQYVKTIRYERDQFNEVWIYCMK